MFEWEWWRVSGERGGEVGRGISVCCKERGVGGEGGERGTQDCALAFWFVVRLGGFAVVGCEERARDTRKLTHTEGSGTTVAWRSGGVYALQHIMTGAL